MLNPSNTENYKIAKCWLTVAYGHKKKATISNENRDPYVIRLGLRNPAVNHWELTSYIFVDLGMPLFAHLDISMFFFVYGCKDNDNSPIFSD
ncbi:MAG: hypothetical protein HDS87_07120 [Bacteroidales bacterium]|nr:hypothetical protein [Bacteroidales bacterium]